MPSREALPEPIQNLSRIQGFELRDNRWESDLATLFQRLVELGLKRSSAELVRYPKPMVDLKELTDLELSSALESLPGWSVSLTEIPGFEPNKRTELFRTFEFASFEDAIAFMGTAAQQISKVDHHPRWE